MKTRNFFRFVLAIVLLLSATVYVPSLEMIMAHHPFPQETARDSIDELIAELYRPIAMDLDLERGVDILYYRDLDPGETEPLRWVLYRFTDFANLEAEFSEFLGEGYLPVDIGGGLDSLSVLFVELPARIDGWRLTASPLDESSIQDTVQRLGTEGFDLQGLSYDDERIWYLFLRFADQQPLPVTIAFTSNDMSAITDNVNRYGQDGWFPAALAVLPDERIVLTYRQLSVGAVDSD